MSPVWSRASSALIVLALAFAFVAAEILKPNAVTSDVIASVDLQTQIPSTFGDWKMEPGLQDVIEETGTQRGKRTYSQVLSRTYVNSGGDAVMLSIAYGANQNREETQVHRPEICYQAQGFSVRSLRDETLRMGNQQITVRRVLTQRGRRIEPLSYWLTAGEQSMLPGLSRKLAQLRMNLSGRVVDGMLLRVSTIEADQARSFSNNGEQARAFSTQDDFVRDLATAIQPAPRKKYFGF